MFCYFNIVFQNDIYVTGDWAEKHPTLLTTPVEEDRWAVELNVAEENVTWV